MKIEESDDGTITITADRRETTTIRNALSRAAKDDSGTQLGRNVLPLLAKLDTLLGFEPESQADAEPDATAKLAAVRTTLFVNYALSFGENTEEAVVARQTSLELLYTADTGVHAPHGLIDEGLMEYEEGLREEVEAYRQKLADEFADSLEGFNPYEV